MKLKTRHKAVTSVAAFFSLFVRLQTESGYSQAQKKTILEKLSEWLLEIIDKIRELVAEGHLNDVSKEFANAQAEQFADVRQKFLQVLDEIEGVEGAEGVKNSNKRLTNKGGKSYNKNSTYDEFTSNGMQWAYSAGTKVGDTRYLFNGWNSKYCIIEATKTDVGFIVIEELSSAEWRKKYGRTKSIRNEGRSIHWNTHQYESVRRRNSDNSNGYQYRGKDGRNVRLSEEEKIQSSTSGNLERDGQNNQEVQESIKRSIKGLDFDYLSAVENGDTETAQKMVDEVAKLNGYDSPVLYHGTHSFGFTEFDLDKMDDKRSIFLTSSKEIASTYSGVTDTKNIVFYV